MTEIRRPSAPLKPLRPPSAPTSKHLVERYQHRAQVVTCTCGWTGPSTDGSPVGWKAHLAEMRIKEAAG
jgi:hypothetical protein